MIRLLLVFLCAMVSVTAFSQEGDYFLSHFVPPSISSDHQIFDLEQDDQGILYMAHKSGIIAFDGKSWQEIPDSTSLFAIEKINGRMITGGPTGFRELLRNEDFEWEYIPLNAPGLVKDIIRMIQWDGILYGMSPTNIYSYNVETSDARAYSSTESEEFINLYTFKGKVYVLDASGTSYVISGEHLKKSKEEIASKALSFVEKMPGKDIYLTATKDNELYLYNNEFKKILNDVIDGRDLDYLRDSEILSGLWISDTLAVVSTLKGGVVFLNPLQEGRERRNVVKIVNYQNDLPDNEVFTMNLDDNGGVWVGHEKGFTRIAPKYPFRRYDRFPGLEGKILNAYKHNGTLYVGTSQGLFYLNETPVYEKVRHRYKEWVTVNSNERKGFFNRLFGKNDVTARKEQREVVETKKEFHSIQYQYIRVNDIQSKVFHLASVNGKLIAAGLDGIFEVERKDSRRMTSIPVKYFHYSEVGKRILAATYEGNIIEISLNSGNGSPREILGQITEPINYIFENTGGNLFLVGMHAVFMYDGKGNLTEIPFENPFYEETYGLASHDSVFLINKSGVYNLKPGEGVTTRVNTIRSPQQLLQGVNDQVWLLGPAGWHAPGKGVHTESFRHLTVLNRIRFISESRMNEGLWVITENGVSENALYHLLPQETYDWYQPNKLFLEEVSIGDRKKVSPTGRISFEQENSNVSFVFRQPEFSGVMDTEYKYELMGEQEDISEWSAANQVVRFTYLPAGDYTLRIRSRNALGQVSELSEINFRVLAPYWKRTWFYALEFAIIALMLLISIRMKAMGYKYRLVSRLLALLTLITIIELIQALAESKFETETSPVFGFVIQVLMAIMILPVEEILRKYIFKEKHVKVFDIFSLRDKNKEVPLSEQPVVAGSADELQSGQ